MLWIKRLVRKREHKEELGAPVVKLNPTVKENTAVRVKPPVATRPATVVNPVAKDLPKPGQIVCSRCKVTVPQREAVLNQNHWFCANCSQPFKKSAEEQKSILREHCCKCKKLVSNQEFVFADGSYYCAACFSAEYPQEDWSIKMM